MDSASPAIDRERLNGFAINADVAVSELYLQSGLKAIIRALNKLRDASGVDIHDELNEIEGLVELFDTEIRRLGGPAKS